MTPLEAVQPFSVHLSRPPAEVAADLERFRELLTKWQRAQNLVSRETLSTFWTRHVGDSLQVLTHVRQTDQRFTDLGSGGGLPGVPIAIGLRRIHVLVESNAGKASFLRTVARDLSLPIDVKSLRIEAIDSRETPDVITARALAPLRELLTLALPLFGPQTRAIFHKGKQYRAELDAAGAAWDFDVIEHESLIERGGALLEITNPRPRSVR